MYINGICELSSNLKQFWFDIEKVFCFCKYNAYYLHKTCQITMFKISVYCKLFKNIVSSFR